MSTATLEKKSLSTKKKNIDIEEFRKLSLKEKSKFLQGSVRPNNITMEEIVEECRKARAEVYQELQREKQCR
jgi:hypothetical protein